MVSKAQHYSISKFQTIHRVKQATNMVCIFKIASIFIYLRNAWYFLVYVNWDNPFHL